MFGLELSVAQKLEIGFVAAVLCIAAYLVYRGTRSSPDMTVTSWAETRRVGIDPRHPISAKNPADPARTVVATVFACHDGRVEITEYPAESGLKSSFVFMPDLTLTKRGQTYTFYKDPMARVNAIADPFKHALSFAAYSAALGNKSLNILDSVGLSKDQAKSETELRESMMTQIDLMQNGAQTGIYEPELYDNVLRALSAYRAQEGDPTKDAAKSALAHKVIDRAMEYLGHLLKEESVHIDKYIAGVTALLDDDQKAKLVEAAKAVTVKPPKGARGPRPRPAPAPPPAPKPVAAPGG